MKHKRIAWVGGEHDFALRIGELRALQDARDAGPEEILNRLRIGTWRVDDVVQVIRWGLVGGGSKTPAEAAQLVTPLVDMHPLAHFKIVAQAVLFHAMTGPEDDAPGEAEGVETPAPENGGSAGSTGTEPS